MGADDHPDIVVCLYSDNAGKPDVLLAQSLPEATSVSTWQNIPLITPYVAAANTYYWLAVMALIGDWKTHYVAGATDQMEQQATGHVWPDPADPWGGSHTMYAMEVSIYATYTPTAPPPPSAGVAGGGGFFLDTRYIGERIIEKAAKTAFVYGLNWLVSILLDEDS